MPEKFNKTLLVPIDGSSNSKKALKYLSHFYGSEHNIKITLCYVLPSIPPLFTGPELSKEVASYICGY